jgi:hypothetical protein
MASYSEGTAVAAREEVVCKDRDAGEILIQVSKLEELIGMVESAVRRAEHRLEHVLNPNTCPTGELKSTDAERHSPLADRLDGANDRLRSLCSEIEAWQERIEL